MQEWIAANANTLMLIWAWAGALLGLLTLSLALRRRSVPAGLFSALMGLALADVLILNSYFYTPMLQLLRAATVFLALDVLVLSVVLRLRHHPFPETIPSETAMPTSDREYRTPNR